MAATLPSDDVPTKGRQRFRPIWLAPILMIVALGSWAVASPVGSSPDENFHLTSIWCANAARTDLCKPAADPSERFVPAATVFASSCFAGNAELTASCQDPIIARGPEPTVKTDSGSFESTYPPVFYGTMNLLAGADIVLSVVLMRLLNVLLFVGISTALWLLLPSPRRSSLAWGWLISTVPLGLFLIASDNPSSWAIIGVGSAWLALLGYFESIGKRKVLLGAVYALAVVMASGSRADSAIYVGFATALVVLLTAARSRRYLLSALLPIVMCIVAVVFYLSSGQSAIASGDGLGPHNESNGPLDAFGLLAYNLLNVQSLWAGVFGSWPLGWLDTEMPAIVSFGAFAVFIAVGFAGLAIGSRRKAIALVTTVLVLWVLPTYVLISGGNHVGQNVQPRYLLPLIVMLAGLLVLAARGRGFRLGRWQGITVALALCVAQAIALHVNIRRYVTGIDIQGWNLDAAPQWWWHGVALSPIGVWATGTVCFSALVVIVIREVGRPADRASSSS